VKDMFEILIAIIFLLASIILFIHISQKLRRGGGSLTSTMLGSTDLFYDKEKKKAIAHIVEIKSGKKQVEQASEDPKDKKPNNTSN
jgi:hypothetical protein